MSKLIFLSDIYKLREQKQKELEFYQQKLTELQEKLYWVNREIHLTNAIIDMIEKEKIVSIPSE